ncbi:MAG: ABC transporter permease [Candidatus Acidiferrum sp.]
MPLRAKVQSLVRNLLSTRRVDKDIDEEVRSQLEMLAEENIRAGMPPNEAQRAARIELGGIEQVKEQVREQRLGSWLHSVLCDCRYGLRQLRKSPGFTTVAILTLALGIGATTAIYSIIDGVLLHPYPYKNAERLATPTVFSGDQFRAWRFPAAAFVDFKEYNHTFDDMFGLVYQDVHLTLGHSVENLSGGLVTPGTFESLAISPLLGRPLTAEDAKPGAPPVFLISHRLWTKLFHRDPRILGMAYTLNSTRMTIVGIMPRRFQIGGCDLWLPLNITRDTFVPGAGLVSNEIWTVGHLKPGVSPETAAADLQRIAEPFQKNDPIYFPPHFKVVVNTFISQAVGRDFKLGLYALMAGVSMLLLIACSNVANLLLARATTREKEFGIRSALGASRLRLIRQLLVESLLLAMASCVLGCVFAYLGLKAMVAFIPADTVPPEALIILSRDALLFSLVATILTALICGLAPALHSVRSDLQLALTTTGKGLNVDFRHGRLRSALVAAEVALSIILSICSGLVMRSLFALQNVNLGFNPSKVVYADISWPEGAYDRAQAKNVLLRKVLDHLIQLPGIQAATEASNFPPYTFGWTTVVITGKTSPQNRNTASVFCSEGYFQTLGLSPLRGALFSQNDIESARHVVIVNQSFVRDHFGEENPVGSQVRFSDYETWPDWPHEPYFEIIGVVADAKNSGLQDAPRPEIYLPATLTGAVPRGIMVSTSGNTGDILQQISAEVSAADPNIAIGESGTIATRLEHYYYARPQFLLLTFSTFAAIALLLVAVGIFSVISYTVALQTHEIGIRMALGAQPTQVLTLILRKGMRPILAGTASGLLASYFFTRLLTSEIWGVSPTDPSTFGAIVALALVVGVLACLLPARRAARVDPIVALRYE